MTRSILISEAKSGLSVAAALLEDKAPANAAFLWRYLETPRVVPSIHAIWTGPEISCPIPPSHLGDEPALPPENATLHPQPGDVVLAYVPARMWGGNPDPVFDIGLFYGPGARMLFPIGWLAGSVVAQVAAEDRAALAAACGRIRQTGACEITYRRAE
ncbi:DUF3830 family protein [Rhodobacter sp. SGA-6-6]|uniref:DUF3830 family protein n=1 Tax=Rhodobacter sp. SGA-6-6 TaxID=2710882 RepID=UPI0013E9F8A8|nr:DUF3830 family protein [Rhodobacter sp. SGA-6-6]NGM46239.1 DUF3830 family protein [Rhodobacter sp. SGA-6-6]